MLWHAARASLGYFTADARKIQLDFAKNITGKKKDTDRWKRCTGTAIFLNSVFVCKLVKFIAVL